MKRFIISISAIILLVFIGFIAVFYGGFYVDSGRDNHVNTFVRTENKEILATVYKGNIIKNLIMDCQSYTKYRPNETTGGIFVSWRRKEELPTGA